MLSKDERRGRRKGRALAKGLGGQTRCEDTVHVAFRSHPVFLQIQGVSAFRGVGD